MSLKENIAFLKDEITTEEKFFEGFFKLEKIWKKYKLILISGIGIAVVAFIGTSINNYLETQNKIKANTAFNTLLENPSDLVATKTLKDINPNLFLISQYIANKDLKIDSEYLNTISSFHSAVKANDIEAINKTTLDPKFLLKDYAIFQKALIQARNKDFAGAKETLKLIPIGSSVSSLSNKLNHYLLTKS